MPPYRSERVPTPPDVAAELERLATLHGQAPSRSLWEALLGLGFVIAVVYAVIGLVDLAFGILQAAHWLVLVLATASLVLPIPLIHLREARRTALAQAAFGERLRADLAAGQVLRHTLHRDARHWFVEHEHGVIHVSPADDARTLFLDLSSISDDPRHDHWYAQRLIDRAVWTWTTTTDGRFLLGFEAQGETLAPNSIEVAAGAYDPETGGDLFKFLGSPGDGDLVDRPFADVDAYLRRRIPAAPA
jgi:hypothetical protein